VQGTRRRYRHPPRSHKNILSPCVLSRNSHRFIWRLTNPSSIDAQFLKTDDDADLAERLVSDLETRMKRERQLDYLEATVRLKYEAEVDDFSLGRVARLLGYTLLPLSLLYRTCNILRTRDIHRHASTKQLTHLTMFCPSWSRRRNRAGQNMGEAEATHSRAG